MKSLDLWIIWADVVIQTSGRKPAAAARLEFSMSNPDCGAVTEKTDHWRGRGNMCGIVTLFPAGVGNVVKSGWDIKRERISRDYVDGVKSSRYWEQTWTNDDFSDWDEILIPANDKIYVIDSPNVGPAPISKEFPVSLSAREEIGIRSRMFIRLRRPIRPETSNRCQSHSRWSKSSSNAPMKRLPMEIRTRLSEGKSV